VPPPHAEQAKFAGAQKLVPHAIMLGSSHAGETPGATVVHWPEPSQV
jgi:hypothetical protein